ncbi:MAG: type III secretion protein [Dehalococcoidia bacterium]|nr:type III secretion protein [Dehalococcoidia bacterium]
MEKAVALSYAADLPAPVVVAKGKGSLADAIERVAREHGIYVSNTPVLADALVEMEIGDLIPAEHYRLVAELLVFVASLRAPASGGAGAERD